MKSYRPIRFLRYVASMAAITVVLLTAATGFAQKNLLVKVKKNGKETTLYQKLITVKAINKVSDDPNDTSKVERVGAYNIFYHLKTNDGKLSQNGYYRIGDDTGKHLGWIPEDEAEVWATRFVIKPRKKFTVKIDKNAGGGEAIYDEEQIPGNASAYSFILGESKGTGEDASTEGPFPVAFCITRTDIEGILSELNQIGDMTLEIVFVIENASYLQTDKGGGPLSKYVGDLADEFEKLTKEFVGARIPVRFGLVAFSDTSSNYTQHNKPTIVQPLTNQLSTWSSKLKQITGQKGGGDYPNDGVSALYTAVTSTSMGWEPNSSKHIVYLGFAPFQKTGFREAATPGPPLKNYLTWAFRRTDTLLWKTDASWHTMFGMNTSGKSSNDVLREAFKTAGTVGAELRGNKHIHMVHIGETIQQKFTPKVIAVCKKLNAQLDPILKNEPPLNQVVILAAVEKTNPGAILMAVTAWMVEAYDLYDEIAQREYRTITDNNKNNGYYTHMKPDQADVLRVTKELSTRVKAAIEIISKVAMGKEKEAQKSKPKNTNEITRPLFKLIGSTLANDQIREQPVQTGTAGLVDPGTGKLVGEIRIMVSRKELERLRATFNSLYEIFNKKRKTIDRQDTKSVLDDLKRSLATAAAGQDIGVNTSLAEVITDLPLQTGALKLTAGDIAVMATKDFEAWLEDLQIAQAGIKDLLTGDQSRWIKIAQLEGQARTDYGFIRQSELP